MVTESKIINIDEAMRIMEEMSMSRYTVVGKSNDNWMNITKGKKYQVLKIIYGGKYTIYRIINDNGKEVSCPDFLLIHLYK